MLSPKSHALKHRTAPKSPSPENDEVAFAASSDSDDKIAGAGHTTANSSPRAVAANPFKWKRVLGVGMVLLLFAVVGTGLALYFTRINKFGSEESADGSPKHIASGERNFGDGAGTAVSMSPTAAPTGFTYQPSNSPSSAPTTQSPTLSPTTASPTTNTPTLFPTTPRPTNTPTTKAPTSAVLGRVYESCNLDSFPSQSSMAITFDDGPTFTTNATHLVLDTLKKIGIKATFFVSPALTSVTDLDKRCREIMPRMYSEGHYIACHSWNHKSFTADLGGLTHRQRWDEQMKPCIDWVRNCTGGFEVTHFRPPYGHLTWEQAQDLTSRGMTIAFWNIDPRDYTTPGDPVAIKNAVDVQMNAYRTNYGRFPAGAIVLLHDASSGYSPTANQLSTVERIYQTYSSTYQFVTAENCYTNCQNNLKVHGLCLDDKRYPWANHYQIAAWKLWPQ